MNSEKFHHSPSEPCVQTSGGPQNPDPMHWTEAFVQYMPLVERIFPETLQRRGCSSRRWLNSSGMGKGDISGSTVQPQACKIAWRSVTDGSLQVFGFRSTGFRVKHALRGHDLGFRAVDPSIPRVELQTLGSAHQVWKIWIISFHAFRSRVGNNPCRFSIEDGQML